MFLDAESRTRDQDGEEALLLERTPSPSNQKPKSEVIDCETAKTRDDAARLRMPDPQQHPADAPPVVDSPPLHHDEEPGPNGRRADKQQRSFIGRHPSAAIIGVILALLIAAAGYAYWDYSRHFETTDDSFIAARQFAIAPKVSGYIAAVPVTDNQHVATGDVVARIDDRDYRNALAQSNAQVAAAQASIENMDAQIAVQQEQISANQAKVTQTQAALLFAQQQAARYQDLAQKGSGTVQNSELYTSQLHQQEAALESARATLKLAQRQIDSLRAQRDSAVASLAQAKAQHDQAQLNLSYTTVTAAQSGRIVNLSGAVGQFAQAGTTLSMLVPDNIWVTANFKETQLDAMRPGQKVALTIDAYPDRTIHGHVASVQPGSGPAFSLLPPENATGNWVKIVQRVPVKIVMDDPPADVALGPGMSVETMVRVNPSLSLYERLRARL
jgi:membrane fusion protein, multidrug efflux system